MNRRDMSRPAPANTGETRGFKIFWNKKNEIQARRSLAPRQAWRRRWSRRSPRSISIDMMWSMDIAVRKNSDVTIVDFKGRLAVGVSDALLPRVIDEILGEGSKKILLNLSDMDYIDSNGLGELVQAYRESQRRGASLRLLKPQDRVTKTLRLTNLLPIFSVYESEEDALKAFDA